MLVARIAGQQVGDRLGARVLRGEVQLDAGAEQRAERLVGPSGSRGRRCPARRRSAPAGGCWSTSRRCRAARCARRSPRRRTAPRHRRRSRSGRRARRKRSPAAGRRRFRGRRCPARRRSAPGGGCWSTSRRCRAARCARRSPRRRTAPRHRSRSRSGSTGTFLRGCRCAVEIAVADVGVDVGQRAARSRRGARGARPATGSRAPTGLTAGGRTAPGGRSRAMGVLAGLQEHRRRSSRRRWCARRADPGSRWAIGSGRGYCAAKSSSTPARNSAPSAAWNPRHTSESRRSVGMQTAPLPSRHWMMRTAAVRGDLQHHVGPEVADGGVQRGGEAHPRRSGRRCCAGSERRVLFRKASAANASSCSGSMAAEWKAMLPGSSRCCRLRRANSSTTGRRAGSVPQITVPECSRQCSSMASTARRNTGWASYSARPQPAHCVPCPVNTISSRRRPSSTVATGSGFSTNASSASLSCSAWSGNAKGCCAVRPVNVGPLPD